MKRGTSVLVAYQQVCKESSTANKRTNLLVARMMPTPTTLRTSAFSLANAAIALLCAYLCLMQDVSAAPAGTTTMMHELPPRRGSHISTGFVKPALLVSAPFFADRRGEKSASMSNASSRNRSNAGRQQGQHGIRSSGVLADSYGLMNGMFDNECMQRHMNVREERKQ